MSANTYLQVSELDYDQIRSNLKTFLSNQDQLKDYDFDGSAMSVLLDVLAYNTHYNSFYLNMIGNEMFLDTAQQRDSVVSRAKELGYTPVSSIGASAEVTVKFTGISSEFTQVTVPKNSKFSTTVDDVTYTFVTPVANEFVRGTDDTFTKKITIKESEPLTHRFTVAPTGGRYIIPNIGVDVDSIVVRVQESASDTTTTEFTRASNINQVFSTSPIYFVEESADKKYEVFFGSGSLGKSLKSGNIVTVEYLVNNGPNTNGASTFSVDSISIGTSYSSAVITNVDAPASGGRDQETIESIKFQAPRNFQTQNRAVVAADYERILLSENADLQSVVAFGGEQYDPPLNGRVFIAVKPFGELYATISRKSLIKESIRTRTPLAIDPVVIDGEYTYIIPTITAYYDTTRTALSEGEIDSRLRTTIAKFATDNLERFSNNFRFSRFTRALDNTEGGVILNTAAAIRVQKRIAATPGLAETFQIHFNNELRKGSVFSSSFTHSDFSGAHLADDVDGIINIYRFNASKQKVNIVPNAGTIDYATGTIVLPSFLASEISGTTLDVTVETKSLDIRPIREQVLLMKSDDANITVIGE